MEFIGNTIKSARKRTGITQTKLAELSGVSRATINALENMKAKDISVNTISAILGAIELYIKQKKTSESTLRVSQPKFNFPYVWSNQSPSDELLIKKVLERTIFDDVITLCLHYGVNKVTEVLYASNLKHDALLMVSLKRMIKNIQKGISRD
ncbi:helix-turn-helix transcriptional regulator [Methylotenera sp.]|uniref:helix-turn-helix domain-containing protein n=1 Tax=Methylotenera sp. TaxID=2051956 RepID=UPI0025FC0EE9|nr:helix-turn-helix transcriptional regulator [Methylotenera sp.]